MKKIFIILLVFTLLITYNSNLLAVTFSGPVDYNTIIKKADNIFLGFTRNSNSFKSDKNVIKTDWKVISYYDLKGDIDDLPINLRTIGGQYKNNITMGTQLKNSHLYLFFLKKKDNHFIPVKSSVSIEKINSLSFKKGLNIKINNKKLYRSLDLFLENVSQVSVEYEGVQKNDNK